MRGGRDAVGREGRVERGEWGHMESLMPSRCIGFQKKHTCEGREHPNVGRKRKKTLPLPASQLSSALGTVLENERRPSNATVAAAVASSLGVEKNHVTALKGQRLLYRASESQKRKIFGEHSASYRFLTDFGNRLRETDPDNVWCLEIDDRNRYVRCFFSFGPAVRLMKHPSASKFFTMDACHTKFDDSNSVIQRFQYMAFVCVLAHLSTRGNWSYASTAAR